MENKFNLKDIMSEVKKLQKNLIYNQDKLGNEIIEGKSGGGVIVIEINGMYKIHSIKIDKTIIRKDNIEVLEDLIIVAFNNAIEKTVKLNESEISKLTNNIKIPTLF